MKSIEPKRTKLYTMPTKVYFGRQALLELKIFILSEKLKNIVIIYGEHFKESQECNHLLKDLKSIAIEVHQKEVKASNFITINQVTEYCRKRNFDGIIAIGGGSVLDIGKIVSVLATHEGNVEDYVCLKIRKISKKGLVYIAIPTTAGTGSEVTPWATIWGDDKKKYSLSSGKFMFPKRAIVDPALTDTLPAKVTAESGIDALSQAIEAYWNVNHNRISDGYALEAISKIMESLEKAVNNPDERVRDTMAWAALNSGLAFSNTQTTVCHAVSYPLTAHWNIPHGQAVSLTLPSFVEKIIPHMAEKRHRRLLSALKAENVSQAALNIINLMTNIGLKTRLSDLGIAKNNIKQIAKESFYTERINNSPITTTERELTKLLFSLY